MHLNLWVFCKAPRNTIRELRYGFKHVNPAAIHGGNVAGPLALVPAQVKNQRMLGEIVVDSKCFVALDGEPRTNAQRLPAIRLGAHPSRKPLKRTCRS